MVWRPEISLDVDMLYPDLSDDADTDPVFKNRAIGTLSCEELPLDLVSILSNLIIITN